MLSFSIKLQSNLDLDQTGKERSGPLSRSCAIELTDRVRYVFMREQIAGVPLLLLLVGKQIEYCFLCVG
jgi:hypothetical protein